MLPNNMEKFEVVLKIVCKFILMIPTIYIYKSSVSEINQKIPILTVELWELL